MKAWWGARERLGGSPGAIRHSSPRTAITDVRDALPLVQAPTLVVHRTDDPLLEVERSATSQTRIPGARFVELPGSSTLPWIDADPLLDEIEEFLTGARPAPVADRVLATILFTDIVGSTETARSSVTRRGRGSSSSTTRPFAGSSTASQARRSTLPATASSLSSTGRHGRFAARSASSTRSRRWASQIRAGLHTGEVERVRGEKPRGIAVNVAARVSGIAESGETLVTATVRDLVAGSGPRVRGSRRARAQGARRVAPRLSR